MPDILITGSNQPNSFNNAIDAVIDAHSFEQPELNRLLQLSVGRLMRKACQSGKHLREACTPQEFNHAVDWLKAALINRDSWLSNLDSKDRPKKLMKLGSIEQLMKEADKAMLKAAQKNSGVQLVADDEDLFCELEDGFYLVRLLTPAALDRESAVMQHCIGQGAYDDHLDDDRCLYLSMRDRFGKAHATLEIVEDEILQAQGKQNSPISGRYVSVLIPFLKSRQINQPLLQELGLAIDINGDLQDLRTLSAGLCFTGNIRLPRDVEYLPDDLNIHGILSFSDGSSLAKLPNRLKVGHLNVANNVGITELPTDLEIHRTLLAARSALREIPSSVKIGGLISIQQCPIEALPDGFTVGGNLDVSGSFLKELPHNLVVNGNFKGSDTQIRELKPGVKITGNISFYHGSLCNLPDGFECHGNLELSGTDWTAENGSKGLPRGLKVHGNLSLNMAKLDRLPEGLWVGGNLELENTGLEELPADIQVVGSIISHENGRRASHMQPRTYKTLWYDS